MELLLKQVIKYIIKYLNYKKGKLTGHQLQQVEQC